MQASCQCGELTVTLHGQPEAVVACHCIACQRRTGSVFGVLAYYPDDRVRIAGAATRFTRPGASGDAFQTFFCPVCGATVYVRTGRHPAGVGVAVGAIGDPGFAPPVRSIWESAMHGWVSITSAEQHFPRGRSG